MKKLLIILMLFPLISWGQKDTTQHYVSYQSTWNIGVKNDTTKVIMLVCDTSAVVYSAFGSKAFCILGYECYKGIREKNSGWIEYEYLDENKKPLRKSIIVWQSKQIE